MELKRATNKFKNWLKDGYNLTFFIILIVFILFRLYFFFSTFQQPLWWDEAYYMNNARVWTSNFSWEIDSNRPVLFPFVLTVFSFLGFKGEFLPRIFLLLSSIAIVPLIFAIGKIFFDKKVALISAIISAVFWSFAFFSYRILVDIPLVMLWLATIYLFFNAYYKEKSYKSFIIPGIFLGMSFLMKFSSILLVFMVGIYLFATEKLKVFSDKKAIAFYLASLITVLPFFIWQYLSYGSPLAFFSSSVSSSTAHSFLQSLFDQTIFAIKAMHFIFMILFIVGVLVIISYVLLLINKIPYKQSLPNKYFFILLWIIVSLIFFGWFDYGQYIEERYFFIFYPALFLLAGEGAVYIHEKINKYNKQIAFAVIIIILTFGSYQNITHANQIISLKKESFLPLKQAGLYVNQNTNPQDMIFLIEEPAEIVYYSERNYFYLTNQSEQKILELIKEKSLKYAVLSFYYSLNDEKKRAIAQFIFNDKGHFTPVASFGPYINEEKTVPLVVVFKINV